MCAIDLDDTLLGPDHKLSARNAAAIRAVQARGVTVLIASGRMFAATLPTARELELDTPIICYNGAMVKHPRTGETWMERSIPAEIAGLTIVNPAGWTLTAREPADLKTAQNSNRIVIATASGTVKLVFRAR